MLIISIVFTLAADSDEGEGDWQVRKAHVQRACLEWLPIREQEPGNYNIIYRRFAFGDLIDLSILDTRLEGRDKQVGTEGKGRGRPVVQI